MGNVQSSGVKSGQTDTATARCYRQIQCTIDLLLSTMSNVLMRRPYVISKAVCLSTCMVLITSELPIYRVAQKLHHFSTP